MIRIIKLIPFIFILSACQNNINRTNEYIERPEFVQYNIEQIRTHTGYEFQFCGGHFPACKPVSTKNLHEGATDFHILFNKNFNSSLSSNHSVLFDFDSAELSFDALDFLNTNYSTFDNKKLLVIGFTDKKGTLEYNLNLAKKRAKEVKDYLVVLGIDENNIKIDYKANCCFIDENNDYLNRRVEILIQ